MHRYINAVCIAVFGFLLYGCATTGAASGEGTVGNIGFQSGSSAPQRMTLGAVPTGEDASAYAETPAARGPRSFGMGMPGGGMMRGTVVEGETTHVRYVPLHRPEVDGYWVMFQNATQKNMEIEGNGFAVCNRDSIIVPYEPRSKWVVRIDRSGQEHILLKPGAQICLTIDPDDACPPNTDRCYVEVKATEYTASTPVVYRGHVRGWGFKVPVAPGAPPIRFE